MTAHSPIRPMSPYNEHCIEVTQYQPPWQALNDFAVNTNFDNNRVDANNPEYKRLYHQVTTHLPNAKTQTDRIRIQIFINFFAFHLHRQMHGIETDGHSYLMNKNNGFDNSYAHYDMHERIHMNSADSLGTLMESDESSKTE